MVAGVKVGAVFAAVDRSGKKLEMLASWPETVAPSTKETLETLASDVMVGHDPVTSKISCPSGTEGSVCDLTTLPLRYGEEVIGAMVFIQSVRSEEQKKTVAQLFQWGSTLLESTLEAAYDEQDKRDPLINDLVRSALQDVPTEVAAHQICNMLAQRLECRRVALGMTKGLQVHISALSEQLRFDRRSTQVREMEAAMEESIDQMQPIRYPSPVEGVASVTQRHQTIAVAHKESAILTVPFLNGSEPAGAILLSRSKNKPFSEHEVKTLSSAVELLGPLFALRHRSEDSLSTQLMQTLKKRTAFLLGPGQMTLKMSAAALVSLLIVLTFLKSDYDVYAKSALEGAIQQVVVAPQQGFVRTAEARSGDRVEEGQLLVSLDDQDLRLEQNRLMSERDKTTKEYQEALVLRQRAKVSILSAQIAQVDARLDLVEEKLRRTRLTAPFSGIVVSGDLSQSLGVPVEKGEQLFEIAREGDYRVALNVDEHDMAELEVGQKGSLRLTGLPYDKIAITIDRITPVASVVDGGNFFRVEAHISEMDQSVLRPGMQGIARIQVGEGSVLWVWTHTLIERLRLWFWSIGL